MPKTKEAARLVAEHENEWDTEQLIEIEGEFYSRLQNGGCSGSRNRQRGNGSWDSRALEVRAVSTTEAREMLLKFGFDPAEVLEKTTL